MDYIEARKRLVQWLRSQMIGPAGKSDIIHENPLKLYHVGVLSPIEFTSKVRFEVPETSQQRAGEDAGEWPSYKRYYTAPSTVGFTFFVSRDAELCISANASVYESLGDRDERQRYKKQSYRRNELQQFEKTIDQIGGGFNQKIWDDRAGIVLESRQHKDGHLCTLALHNTQKGREILRKAYKVESYLFEGHLSCSIVSGRILELPRLDASMMSDEELELELQYKDRKIFAVGHGAAVDWEVEANHTPRIWSEFMPAVEMPALSTNPQGNHKALDLKHLCQEEMTTLSVSMREFLRGYEDWVTKQRQTASEFVDALEQKTAIRMVKRMEVALARMHRGVDLLCNDECVEKAFRLANQAMFNQMQQADKISGQDISTKTYRWRSFQLAFLLATLESVIRDESDFRETMDLIWFPTGGGKTEAYLGLIAILMIWRRLKYGESGGGTVAIMRYTLRLLTRQQFERAARMICALELIRRKDLGSDLGEEPFSIGFWAGGAVSPNKYDEAKDKVRAIKEEGRDDERYNFILTSCPWCGGELMEDGYEYREYYRRKSFKFYCTSELGCSYGKNYDSERSPLPCQVVDEALYDDPPSLLISTIDKFARLPWIGGPREFFGRSTRPPELIIQDELHLVSGPLGSIAGIYEAGIETVIRELGVKPKYIASTATVSEAHNQIRNLYARKIQIFPPPGLSCDDMYFARADQDRPGRMYLGYLAPNLSRQKSMSPIVAALMAAPGILFGQNQDFEKLAEAWWTIMIFNNSLRDVATHHNQIQQNVQVDGIRLIKENSKESGESQRWLNSILKRFRKPRIGELTSLRSAQDCAVTFKELENSRSHPRCHDAVLATNMVSVGLDVSRLALMVVNGQPQRTGEYIQVTGRIGRAEVPGLVVANYYRTQARSLAHYENFRPFHESFHRFVEASSVTPFSHQARRRGLHAALVIALRYSCKYLVGNCHASKIGIEENREKEVINQLLKRFKSACPNQIELHDSIRDDINELYESWVSIATKCNDSSRGLCYDVSESRNDADRLLSDPESEFSDSPPWPTLHSMRNVEESAVLECGPGTADIRFSNLLRSSGIGSVVRLSVLMRESTESFSFNAIVPDIRYWPRDIDGSREIKHVARISRHSKIDDRRLVKPPVESSTKCINLNYECKNCIPATKFPRWSFCRECGLLHHGDQDKNKCSSRTCSGGLMQVHWVLVHPLGYLADVDWHYMAHGKESENCTRNRDEAYLKLIREPEYLVKCTKCKRKGWEDIMSYGKKTWQQPWIRIEAKENVTDSKAEVMPIGDSRMYIPENHRALVIPPESRISRSSLVDRLYSNPDDQKRIKHAKPGLDYKSTIRCIASKYGCTPTELEKALQKIEHGYPLYGEEFDLGDPMQLEYEILSRPIPEQREDEDLVTQHYTQGWKAQSGKNISSKILSLVDRLVMVKRLRMISVFTGFRREAITDLSRKKNKLTGTSLVLPDVSGECDWLPAAELYGEGIFFTLDENLMRIWEEKVSEARKDDDALDRFLNHIRSTIRENEEVSNTPRFVLCHSLSHLLMQQLEHDCGYPAASLQERIYCKRGEKSMAGILIFVAVPDVHGSLGGLMKHAKPTRFHRSLSRALDAAKWCSFDPVCSSPEDSKYEQLNGAACHACLMIPESSCCCNNRYLDRTLINGNGTNLPPLLQITD